MKRQKEEEEKKRRRRQLQQEWVHDSFTAKPLISGLGTVRQQTTVGSRRQISGPHPFPTRESQAQKLV